MSNLAPDFPDVSSFVPHNAPMILIDKLIAVDESSVHCQVFIDKNVPFFDAQLDAVPAWVGIEYIAQTISAWSGYQSSLRGEESPIGFLLGTRRYNSECEVFTNHAVLDVYATQLMQSDGMSAFQCSIECAGKEIISSQLNVFVPTQEQLEEMLKGKNND